MANDCCFLDSRVVCSLIVKAGSLRVLGRVLDHLFHDSIVAERLSIDTRRGEDGVVVSNNSRVLGLRLLHAGDLVCDLF